MDRPNPNSDLGQPETSAEDIRSAGGKYVQRAREDGRDSVTIVAGDIVRELRAPYRVPSVISALGSKRFQRENAVTLEEREGPPSGISTSTRFTYRLNDAVKGDSAKGSSLMALRGVGKDVYQALGGGEAHLNSERSQLKMP